MLPFLVYFSDIAILPPKIVAIVMHCHLRQTSKQRLVEKTCAETNKGGLMSFMHAGNLVKVPE